MNVQNYLAVLKEKLYFNREDLWQAFRDGGIDMSDAWFKAKLQNLLKAGSIIRVGRNAYCVPQGEIHSYEYDYSAEAKKIAAKLQSNYPYLEFRIFEIRQLNEFVNHQLAHNIIFVSAEGDLDDFVFDSLKEEYPGKVLLNPTPELYHQYWYDGMIVIERLITEAPKDKKNAWGSRLEKILVDLFADDLLLSAVSESEYPAIYEQAFQKYVIDESCLFRYAKRRGAEEKILDFINTKTTIRLRTRS